MSSKSSLFKETRTLKVTDKFVGIGKSSAEGDGSLTCGENLSSELYPAVVTSLPWVEFDKDCKLSSPCTAGADEKLFFAANGNFIYDGIVRGELTPGKKTLARLDDVVAIFPDKVYFDHSKRFYYYDEKKPITLVEMPKNEVINDAIELIAVDYNVPAKANDGDMYFNTLVSKIYTYVDGAWTSPTDPDSKKIYSAPKNDFDFLTHKFTWINSSDEYVHLKTTYPTDDDEYGTLKISFYKNGALKRKNFDDFSVGDIISIVGLRVDDATNTSSIAALAAGVKLISIGGTSLTFENSVDAFELDAESTSDCGIITIERMMPSLNCVTRSGDRLWGACGNKIYACAPHDVTRWGSGNSSDTAVMLETGVSEDIIGCADLGGKPVFFTENSIISVTGIYNGYKASVVSGPGLSRENPNSIAYLQGSLYYLSDCGVVSFGGSIPKRITFDKHHSLSGMVGGSDGVRYYLSGADTTYVYDPTCDVWYSHAVGFDSFVKFGSHFLGIKNGEDEADIRMLKRSGESDSGDYTETSIIEFSPFFDEIDSMKTYTRLFIKASLSSECLADVSLSADGGDYMKIGEIRGNGRVDVYEINMIPMRARSIQVKIVSKSGQLALYSLAREYVSESDYNR